MASNITWFNSLNEIIDYVNTDWADTSYLSEELTSKFKHIVSNFKGMPEDTPSDWVSKIIDGAYDS